MTHLGFPSETVILFIAVVVLCLGIDLYAHRADRPMSLRSAAIWSGFWVLVSCFFGGYLWWHHGKDTANLFFTGYVLEKVLSVDNLFVIMAIFSWFSIPEGLRHRVLYWGVIGAVVFRGIFVAAGTALFALGPVVEIIFAALVAYSGLMMLRRSGNDDAIEDYSQHPACRFVHRFFPVSSTLHGHDFFFRAAGKLMATPLFLCLAVVEVSDILFAFDSVPAVIAVSREPLIVYSAMIFAVLGLRSLYFVLEALNRGLVHLEKAVIVLLFFIAAKLGVSACGALMGKHWELSPGWSLAIVLMILVAGITASFISVFNGKKNLEKIMKIE